MENWIIGERISRDNNYNILRIMAAMAVMYGHMYVLLGLGAPVLYANEINSLGFKILMVLSGYMVTQSCVYDSRLSHYVIKRVFRLLPALMLYVCIAIFIIGPVFTVLPLNEYFKNRVTWQYLYNVLMNPRFQLPGVFMDNPYPNVINGSLGGLPIEVCCYVLIYIVLRLLCKLSWRRIALFGLTVLLCALSICQIVFLPEMFVPLWGTNWARIFILGPYFFCGALFAVTDLKKYCNIQVAFLLFVLSVAFHSDTYVINEILAMCMIPYMVISLGECRQPVFSRFFRNADITYGIYLWGFPIQQIFVHRLIVVKQYTIGVNEIFVISFAATAVTALASWYIVEKPVASLIKKIMKNIPENN